ncbi:hypothetical protein KKJ01_18315 [Xenorhabdus bovienii]|uniref:Uncharacterized protein n=1 Tax=Xenorhabdus bovienii TaxID=40576 RepID=A0AAJ1JAI1_XENBV|nr:hypothetical protein [Xenorhabdus bovienii]MDE1480120.1 hypothetical protein [Xenorhabdus bovienii]MDE9511802.1 hypothetical protein [Xenorhabdus bovienii]MDE9523444.1 hypothetical protein [Xenorhabdus bovienii]
MSQNTTVGAFNIGIKYDTDTLNQLEAQLNHIAEQVDRINGRRYDAGMTLAVDTGNKAGITSDSFKAFDVAGKVYMKGEVDAKAIRASHDDHIRQIVREEIRQFVTRERRGGGSL